MSKEITKKESSEIKNYSLDKIGEVQKMAVVLKDYITKNSLSVKIVGKDYVMAEGYAFAGMLLGLSPRIVKVEKLAENKWMAQAEIINKKGEVVSTGYALCSKDESKKKSFDEYAILSMAQTRCVSKAYRNLIGWVVKMADFESTPAEEIQMDEMPKNKLEEAKGKINSCKSVAMLMEYDKKIQSSKKYSKEQKKELGALIKSRSHAIEE